MAAAAAAPPAGGAGPPGQALLSPGILACCGLSSRQPTVCNINSTITLLFLCCSGHAVRPGPQRPTWERKAPSFFSHLSDPPGSKRLQGRPPGPWSSCKAPQGPHMARRGRHIWWRWRTGRVEGAQAGCQPRVRFGLGWAEPGHETGGAGGQRRHLCQVHRAPFFPCVVFAVYLALGA